MTQVLFVAPSEEICFRYLIPLWMQKNSPFSSNLLAGLASAALFSFFHATSYSFNIASMAIAFLIGFLWYFLFKKWGIGATIGSHAAYNLLLSGIFSGGVI